ncbi:MAG: HD domain-containing protein [Bacteroidota bacterium]
MAEKLGENIEIWGFTCLLHDLDIEITNANPKVHGLKTAELLREYSINAEIIDAIELHNEEATHVPRTKKLHYALAAGETITGLIFATTYVYPSKKIADLKPISVVKRMKEKHFAASVKRDNILECEKIGIPIDEFAAICVEAMKKISSEIGL